MISKETAIKIWMCYREIEAGLQLREDVVRQIQEEKKDRSVLRDIYELGRSYQLSAPDGVHSKRILDVSPRLALAIVNVHLGRQQKELVEACEQARVEMEEKGKETYR